MEYISRRKRAQQIVSAKAKTLESAKPKPKRAAVVPKSKPPADDPPAKRADEFPLISVLPKSAMQTVLGLMTMDLELAQMEKELKANRADGKAKIHAIIQADEQTAKAGGLRWGQLAVYDRGMVSRPSCTTENLIKALLEAGVEADVIDQARKDATEPGKEFLDLKVTDLSKKPEKDSD